jgi:hypothetical protein
MNIPVNYLATGGSFGVLVLDERVIGTYGLHNEGDGVAELRDATMHCD